MSTEFEGLEELMWGSIKIKKDEILKNDKDFLVTTAKNLLNQNSFRLFSTDINHKIEVLGKSINVHFEKPENLKLNLQNN